jgi:hypothetical protein
MIKCGRKTTAIFYLLLFIVFVPLNSIAGEIQIDLFKARSSLLKQGLVHGLGGYTERTATSDIANTWISATKPGSWRFSGIRTYGYGDMYKFIVEDYHYDSAFRTITVFNLQDIFNAKYGNPITINASCLQGETGCFASFANLRQAWNTVIRNFLVNTKGAAIAFFDLLAEPEFSFRNTSQVQLYELAKDAYYLVKEIRPDAKTVGPSIASFRPVVLDALIANMVVDGIHFDAISWHELGNDPEVIGQHVATFKSLLQKYPAICQPSCPEIHINEYQGEETMLVPGHAVGWLSNLESSSVNQANRACWGGDPGSPITYQSCWYGFSGFLTPDSSTPQPLYWVYKFYADLNSRFATQSTLSKISAISGQLSNGAIGVLVGNYGATQSGQLRLLNFVWASAQVDVFRIANTYNQVRSLPRVDRLTAFNAVTTNSVLTFQLDKVAAGDAYWIVITPSNLILPWSSVR